LWQSSPKKGSPATEIRISCASRIRALGLRLSLDPKLLQHADDIVEKILLDDLAVLPLRYRAKVDLELIARWRIVVPLASVMGPFIVPVKRAMEQVQSPPAKSVL